jgi:SAM-dependent methyltransferase
MAHAHSHAHDHSHDHSHDQPADPADPYVVDWDDAAPRLAVAAGADAPWYASVAATLVTPADRITADIGCGGAGMAAALAAAMTEGRVLAVDGDSGVLEAAQERLGAAAYGSSRAEALAGADGRSASSRAEVAIEFVLDDLDGDLSAVRAATGNRGADVAWASASVHHAGDQQQAVDILAGLLAPGGRLALAEGGLPMRCLPWDVGVGEPGLEIRLDAAQDIWFARMRRQLPGAVPMPYGWPNALRRAGLTDVRTATWLFEAPTPLTPADRTRVVGEFGHRVERLKETGLLADDDVAAWARLLDEGDPAWLGHRDDLQRLTARSVHIGHRAD